MDTLFSQDEQQHLLDMLNSHVSISSSFDNSIGVSVPSLSSSDESPPPSAQQCEGDDFHDPILQYINNLLMEEDIDNENCTPRESIAYQATVKNFSEILNDNNENISSRNFTYGEKLSVSEQDFYPAKGVYRQESNELYADRAEIVSERSSLKPSETAFSLPKGKISLGSQPLGPQGILDLSSEPSMGHVYAEAEMFVPPNKNGNSTPYVSSESLKQQISNGSLNQQMLSESMRSQVSNQSLNQKSLHGSLRPQISNSLTPHVSNTLSHRFISIPGMPSYLNENLRSQLSHQSSHQGMLNGSLRPEESNSLINNDSNSLPGVYSEEPLQSSASHKISFNNLPVYTIDSTMLKRSSPEESNSIDEEDSVSFVKNKDLEAEQYAKDLNVGLTKIIEQLKEMGPKTVLAAKSHKSKPHKLETTADLKNMLLSCAQAVVDGNTRRANEILKDIRQEATPYGDDLQRLGHYFAEGLVARITGTGVVVYNALSNNLPSTAKFLKAHRLFVDLSPFNKVSNFFANGAIVKAAKDACRLHIIDYGIWYGIQWPSLISALAVRKGGPPLLRMTIIEFPDLGNNPAGRVEWTGKKLSDYSSAYGVPFEYQVIADKWENITSSTVGLRDGEILVVNSMFRLCEVLDESVMPSNPRTTILKNILKMNPKLFVHGVVNGSYTSPFFLPRFREALSSYSSMFNVLETLAPRDSQERFMYEREYLGREILNVVACEGRERVVRPTTYKQWQSRMQSVGFVQISCEEKMVKSVQDIVRLNYNENFNVDMDGDWMLIGWKGKIRKALTLWRCR